MSESHDAAQTEREMQEHEREARERDPDERNPDTDAAPSGSVTDENVGTPDSDAMPAPPGNVQGGNLGGAS